ncbi:MAG: cysteine desulfurase, partial [Candidatus Krumholzibacteriota bacterium]|nr:cysteine desulfurase [Candidatus Krumholzibacteriota bacterium]
MPPIYLDYNATTPLAPEVISAMRPFLDGYFGNPSSSHWFGRQARRAVTEARIRLAGLLGCGPEELIFTSGGSESNNLALQGAARALREKGNHIITSSIEHPAVTEVCRYLEDNGFRVTYLPVDETGLVSVRDFREALTNGTILASIMHANNEVGTIQPIAELAAAARERGVIFHSDAAQSVGKVTVNVRELGVDMLSVAGHKFYAPKGIGALYIRTGVPLSKLIHGADHERNLRAGTENVLEIAGLGKAAQIAQRDLDENYSHMRKLRDRLQEGLLSAFPDSKVNGDLEKRLPNTLSISFPLVEANTLLD